MVLVLRIYDGNFEINFCFGKLISVFRSWLVSLVNLFFVWPVTTANASRKSNTLTLGLSFVSF